MGRSPRDVGLQTLENKALSWGVIGKSAPILAEIIIRKSQLRIQPGWEAVIDYRAANPFVTIVAFREPSLRFPVKEAIGLTYVLHIAEQYEVTVVVGDDGAATSIGDFPVAQLYEYVEAFYLNPLLCLVV